MDTYEKLGVFYLGRAFDLANRAPRPELLLYDSKDLTTHAVCVGMTGSGKTGLCLALLEEAAIDGVPAIAVDPKGDLGNLLLTFPQLRSEDFRPWIDESAAGREGISADDLAARTAAAWREGLAAWGQGPERIARFREAADLAIYTPGSSAGLPLSVLGSFAPPSREALDDADALRDRVASAASGLLALLGIEADPVQSREHILVSSLLDRAWREGQSLDVARLIQQVQSPPLDKVGVLDVETFYPAKDRAALAMKLNNLLASPSFAGWMEGEPLDVKRLLYTPEGKPRLSVISIAHLSDAERMFFVTILLGEVLAWVRSQPGTSSLRALFYMDEVFGYFPPTANPPSKRPMLTLLKQARAFGLGVVLATQNPVDLDYKGLSNAGTWFLGRLQTERDKMRVLEGLEGASAAAGATFDRGKMEAALAALGNRVFLMNNVHEDQPVVFQTRWALSYLRGPLTRNQIQSLMAPRKQAQSPPAAQAVQPAPAPQPPVPAPQAASAASRAPLLPPGVEVFCLGPQAPSGGAGAEHRPALLGRGRLHFVDARCKVDCWQDRALLASVEDGLPDAVWDDADRVGPDLPGLEPLSQADAPRAPLPAELGRPATWERLQKELKEWLYRTQSVAVWKCAALGAFSGPDEPEGEFRIRLASLAREARDREVEKLRGRYAPRLARLREQIRVAEERVAKEQAEAGSASVESVVSIGSSILGALLGRKLASRTNLGKVSSSVRSLGRASRQKGDVGRAEGKVEALRDSLAQLEAEFEDEAARLEETCHAAGLSLEQVVVKPRKSDVEAAPVALVWRA